MTDPTHEPTTHEPAATADGGGQPATGPDAAADGTAAQSAPTASAAPPGPPAGATPSSRVLSRPVIGALLLLLAVAAGLAIHAWLDPERRFARLRVRDPEKAARLAAEISLRGNPNYERVAVDDEAGTMTVRNKTSGAELTLRFDELLSDLEPSPAAPVPVESEDPVPPPPEVAPSGPDDIPPWVPRHPREKKLEVNFATGGDGAAGAFAFRSDDGASAILDHYDRALRGAGYQVERQTLSAGAGSLVATLDGGRRSVRVAARTVDGETTTAVQYQQRAPAPAATP